jgi:predicted ATP-grasp superfamily ATP-dependent carboligase
MVFGTKMIKAHTIDEMTTAYQQAVNAGMEVMLQEHIPGDDTHGVNYNAYFWDGKPLVEFTAEKVRLAPQGFGVPRVVISKKIEEVLEPGRKILKAMGFYGYACTEFKRDARDGKYKLMEVNGRHNLSSLLSVKCGINFPWLEYRHLVLGERPSPSDFRTGIYWIDLTKDVIYSVRHYRQERYTFSQYLRPYVKPHTFAILSISDPMPFLKRCFDILELAARKLIAIVAPKTANLEKAVKI